jgi:hypothetical protein
VPYQRWDVDALNLDQLIIDSERESCLQYGNFIENIEMFDPQYFGISMEEAMNLDPCHRSLMETCFDSIYDAGINPFISTPSSADSTGSIIINGQRTLLVEGSALDRINVRRLLIEVRRRVKAVAYSLLFEPNRESTIARFNSAVTPIMKQIQSQRGVERYRVQIDATTTTQADIENNTIRGKIYLQPTKAVEFVSIDFEAKNAADF